MSSNTCALEHPVCQHLSTCIKTFVYCNCGCYLSLQSCLQDDVNDLVESYSLAGTTPAKAISDGAASNSSKASAQITVTTMPGTSPLVRVYNNILY